MSFHIIDETLTGDSRNPSGAPTYIKWSDPIFDSFRTGNYNRRFDLDIYLELPTPKSRRLYRYISRKIDHLNRPFEIGLERLAYERLGLSRQYPTYRLRREVEQAAKPIMDRGVILDFDFDRMENGHPKVVFHLPSAAPRKAQGALPEPVPPQAPYAPRPALPAPERRRVAPSEPEDMTIEKMQEHIAVLEAINPDAAVAAREKVDAMPFRTRGRAYFSTLLSELRRHAV